jgi:hypothetical protein
MHSCMYIQPLIDTCHMQVKHLFQAVHGTAAVETLQLLYQIVPPGAAAVQPPLLPSHVGAGTGGDPQAQAHGQPGPAGGDQLAPAAAGTQAATAAAGTQAATAESDAATMGLDEAAARGSDVQVRWLHLSSRAVS